MTLGKLSLVLALAGLTGPCHGLIGGRNVGPGDVILSHFVALAVTLDQNGNRDACSGVLISPRHVLTAGHCLTATYRRDPAGVEVLLFRNARDVGASLRAASYEINPGFLSGAAGSDLAVVTLADPLPPKFGPMAMALDQMSLAVDTAIEVAGVGLDSFKRPTDGWLVKRGRLKFDHADGAESWLRRDRDGVPCLGDSGGPAYVVDPVTKVATLVGIQTDYTFDGESRRMTGAMIVHPARHADWLARAVTPKAGEDTRSVRLGN